MAEQPVKAHKPLLTPEQEERLKKKLEVKNFDFNAILRGAQLTVVGGLRTTLYCLIIITDPKSPSSPSESRTLHF
jgi:hypothetical protein